MYCSSSLTMSVGSFVEPCVVPYRYRPMRFATGASKKNLIHIFGSDDDAGSNHETIKVYLRLKPGHHDEPDQMNVLDAHTLLVKAPSADDYSRRKNPDSKYTFSKIFRPYTDQKELFAECVQPLVKDFLDGQNCLLFSFGTTNSGKTFTIQGTAEHPGIIPRALAMTFKSLSGNLSMNNILCPHQVMSAIELTKNERFEIDDMKHKILYWNENDSAHGHLASNFQGSCEDLLSGSRKFSEMQYILDREVNGIQCHDYDDAKEASVWVCFIEIYNEKIFDLLDPCERGRKRKELKLAQDMYKNNYVKGVRYIPVKSAAEAYKVLVYGRNNLQIESTNLNSSSSRSHCIFTIKVLKYSKLSRPEIVNVSSFSICDLAGSERQKKTLNGADRLKESQCINSSLHVLNRCFNIIRENQMRNDKQLIPYRDSKLTQLFKRALGGHEFVTMIVNVSSSKILHDETQYALKASAIAHQIVVQPKQRVKNTLHSSRFSQYVSKHTGGGGTTILWDSTATSESSGDRDGSCDSKYLSTSSHVQKLQEEAEALWDYAETLHGRLKIKKEELRQEKIKNFTLEHNLRKQLTSEFQKILDDTESRYKKQFDSMWKYRENTFDLLVDTKINFDNHSEISQNKRKRCDSEGSYIPITDSVIKNDNMQQLHDEIEELNIRNENAEEDLKIAHKKIESMAELLASAKCENAELSVRINDLKLENGLMNHETRKLQKTIEGVQNNDVKSLLGEIGRLKEDLKDKHSLLEEARLDIEHEIKEKEQAESDLEALEFELAEKDDIIRNLKIDLENMKQLLAIKEERIDYLEGRLENYIEIGESNKQLETEVENLKILLAEKTDELKSAETEIKQQEELGAQLAKAMSDMDAKDKQILDLEKEIKTLLPELKRELQKNQELNEKITKYDTDLKAVRSLVRDLQEVVNSKDQTINCMQNKLDAFEQTASILTAYKDEVDKKSAELMEAKAFSEKQTTTIRNLESEINAFQNNQKLINGKYDEQLRKCKEELEREKREAAKLRETWIKLTPKSTEDYVKKLELELESLKISEDHRRQYRSPCHCNQENKSVQKKKVAKSLMPPGVCTRSMKAMVEDGIAPLSEQKTNRQTTTSAQKKDKQNLLELISTCDEKWATIPCKSQQSSCKKSRRKLYSNTDQLKSNNEDTEQIEEIPFTFQFHHSPNSVIKCNLRQKFDNQPS